MTDAEPWYTVEQIAEMFQVSEETVRRWVRNGEIPALALGGRKAGYRIRKSDVDTFVAGRYGVQKNSGE